VNNGRRDSGRESQRDDLGRSVAQRAGELKDSLPLDAVRLLREVEGSLVEVSRRAPEKLARPTLEALTAGGKRLRPLLLILSASLGNADRDAVLVASTAIEVLHTATLIHDDIVDRADSRRGMPTTVAAYGRETAVAAGDYLFAEAFADLAAIGNPRLIRAFAEASEALATGELEQYRATGSEIEVEVYLDHIRMKTAGLFKAACVAGGSLGGLSLPQIDALSNYGQALGVAFQMSDDVMDFVGQPGVTGKSIGGDLAEGTVTLPVIFALREGDAGLIHRVLADPEPPAELLEAGIDAVLATDAVAKTEAWARGEVEAALEDLALLPETEERAILEAIAREVVGRDA
jgi:geranylgeranyl pyrophosphate synthase